MELSKTVQRPKGQIPDVKEDSSKVAPPRDHSCSEAPFEYLFCHFEQQTGVMEHAGCMRLHHRCVVRKVWDGTTAILLIWTSLTLPVVVGFQLEDEFLTVIATVIDACFLLDLALGFVTTFDDVLNKELVTDFGAIAKDYLTGWFTVDFTSSIPLHWMGLDTFVPAEAFRAIKLLKLLKLLRIFRLGRLLSKVQERFQIKHATVMIIQFIFIILFAAHWLGCLFYFASDNVDEDHTWLTEYLSGTGDPIGNRSNGEKYVACFYWALTTMSTVGYGDIIPISTTERIMTTLAMVLGACTFAYGLTNVCTLLFNHNKARVEFEGLTDEMNDFMSQHNINYSLCQQVQAYLWYMHNSSHIVEDGTNMERMLARLTPELRDKVSSGVMLQIFRKDRAMQHRTIWSAFDKDFMIELARAMNPQGYAPGEHLIGGVLSLVERREQNMSSRRMYMLTKGNCQAFVSSRDTTFELACGSSFGEQSVLFGRSLENVKVVTASYVDIYWIAHDRMLQILQLYPVVNACLRHVFRGREHDFVLGSELESIHGEIDLFMEENVKLREKAAALRGLETSEAVKEDALSEVLASRTQKGNMREVVLKASIAEAEDNLQFLQKQLVEMQQEKAAQRQGKEVPVDTILDEPVKDLGASNPSIGEDPNTTSDTIKPNQTDVQL